MANRNLYLVMDVTYYKEQELAFIATSFVQAMKFCIRKNRLFAVYLVKENQPIVQSYQNLVACYKNRKPCLPQDLQDEFWRYSKLPPKWLLKDLAGK